MPSRKAEWLGESEASRHVCNDLRLLWDVMVKEEPILLRHLLGELKVYMTRTVKRECHKNEGVPVVLHLCKTLHIPQAKTNLFSLQKLKKAHYRVEQPERIGREWIRSESG